MKKIFIIIPLIIILVAGSLFYFYYFIKTKNITPTPKTTPIVNVIETTTKPEDVKCNVADIINPKDEILNSNWNGTWTEVGSDNFNNAVLTISNATATKFIFNIDAQAGADIGTMSNFNQYECNPKHPSEYGTLKINGNTATYTESPAETYNADCITTFELSSDNKTIKVSEGDSKNNIGGCDQANFGFGVYANGDFRKDTQIKDITTKDAEIFKNDLESYQAFETLMGATYIKNIFYPTLQIGTLHNDSQFGGNFETFAVEHAYNGSESIIMTASGQRIWAAGIDYDEQNNQSIVRYFTNVPEWKNKLPDAINNWIANKYSGRAENEVQNYPVIYMSK